MVGIPSFQIEEKRLGRATRPLHGHMRRHAQIEKQLGPLGSPADAPGLSATNAAEIGDALVPAISGFLLPAFYPFQYHAEHLVKSPDGVTLCSANRERRVDIHARNRNPHP